MPVFFVMLLFCRAVAIVIYEEINELLAFKSGMVQK
jgi:hypothetical protein